MNTGNYLYRTLTLLSGLFWLVLCTNLLRREWAACIAKRSYMQLPILGRIESADLIYQKASGRANITGSITITDADSKNLRSASIRITEGYHADEDVLIF